MASPRLRQHHHAQSGDLTVYQTPLVSRYGSEEMAQIFSEARKVQLWRQLWVWLAEAQKTLGLGISNEQIDEMKVAANSIDFERAAVEERRRKNDVIAHLVTFAGQCPNAASVIHLGANTAYVTDNADQICIRDALSLLLPKLARTVQRLALLALQYKDLPCLGYTHLLPAAPTTFGKRAALWTQELLMDLRNLDRTFHDLNFLGAKGSTGSQSTFVDLFDGNFQKVEMLDQYITEQAGFGRHYVVCGQTYPRKADADLVSALAGLGASVTKICSDLRVLVAFQEVEEPFDKEQPLGSSRRAPQRCERACSLGRHLMGLGQTALATAAAQCLERTMDDSAARRIVLPEAFLSADACLHSLLHIADGLVVFPKVILRRLDAELPFLVMEQVVNGMVSAGGDRHQAHAAYRRHANEVANQIREGSLDRADLDQRLKTDPVFRPIAHQLNAILDPRNNIGCAKEQVDKFVENEVRPALKPYAKHLEKIADIPL